MGKITPTPLEDELQSSYIDYAMSVIIGRAIPDARDGLKPVQRRILWAMYNINNLHNQPTKKSARIVGEIIGKYHPHGDQAIYEALVRMAQDFSMNHLLVEGQGNMGSIDGDPPAAMRYTEVRLQRLAEEMLADIDKETVEMVPNFDNTENEPLPLPSKVPNLLVNGSAGIAVGVATSIPPHNMGEVCDAVVKKLDKGDVTVDELLEIIKGPDFPTGGIALMSGNSFNAYRFGRGQVTVRGKASIEEAKKRIVITEIPYNVNKSQLVQTMAQLVREKRVLGVKDLRDESDKAGISIIVDLREDAAPQQILNQLYKHTQLETTFPIINLAVIGKNLRSMNVLQMINTFLDHRRDVVTRRSKYELRVAKDRLHIVEGMLIAIDNIDGIVKRIKESKEVAEARKGLIEQYKLTEKQANAILDMKLSRLTRLENDSLNKEKKELQERIAYHTEVISKPEKVDSIIRAETLDLKKRYAKPRKTEIIVSEEQAEIREEDMIANEKVTVIMTNNGYVKRLGIGAYREQSRGGKGIIAINLKEGDFVKQILTCNTKDFLICVSNQGRAYWLKAYNVPEGSRYAEGRSIVNLLNLQNERIVTMLNIKDFEHSKIVFLTARGTAKKLDASLFKRPRSTGVRAITLLEGDEIQDTIVCKDEKYVIVLSRNGKSIKFDDADLRFVGRGAMGVRGMRLAPGDVATNVIAANDTGSILSITENGYGKLTDINEYRTQGRGGQGVINIKINEKTGPLATALFVGKEQKVMLINSAGVSITFPISEIRTTGRAASGVRLMRVEQGTKVIDARFVEEDTEQPKTA